MRRTAHWEPADDRPQRPRFSCHPRADRRARRGAEGDARAGDRHLRRSAGCDDRQPARRPAHDLPHRGPRLHLRRQWPRRMGSRIGQHAVARRPRADSRLRALRRGLGRNGCGARCGGGEPAWIVDPRGGRRRARSPPARRPHEADRSRSGGPRRYGFGRGQRHSRDPPRHRRRRPSGAADGRCHRLARRHAVRDGCMGGSTWR